jgi:hypothetical protein
MRGFYKFPYDFAETPVFRISLRLQTTSSHKNLDTVQKLVRTFALGGWNKNFWLLHRMRLLASSNRVNPKLCS